MADETPGAGPSTITTTNEPAPEHPLPSNHYYAVEFPGNVQQASAGRAIEHLGGQSAINRAFKRNAPKTDSLLELNWRPEDPFSHPIPGDVVHANNILLKVTKRKRKRRDGVDLPEPEGEFVAEAVGIVPKTVRFRSMADFQYNPDTSDPVVQFRSAMDRMDVEYIRNYVIPPEKEDYELPTTDPEDTDMQSDGVGPSSMTPRSNLRLIPPPVFSRQQIPQIYNYKANTMSVVTTYADPETGEEKKRLINRARWKGYGPATVSFSDKTIPLGPPEAVAKATTESDKRILDLLKQRFDERPCWTKTALFNQFNAGDSRELMNSKHLLPSVCYVFSDGPWRDTLLKFGYDPRAEPSARFYQRLYFRNLNHPIVRPSIVTSRQDQRNADRQGSLPPPSQIGDSSAISSSNESPSHIFDGIHLTKETAAFQLCDIVDPMIKEMVEDEEGVRDECNERDGWYTTEAIDRIKTVLRHKFFSLLEGHIPSEEECKALLENSQESRFSQRRVFQPRKHNMAKGALAPEDAAAVRLRAKLDIATKAALNRNR
ncbi:uncharacterized protein FOMMEDRAFT_158350 [Fomitiporia mediterranea MF3/22]|uniref:uncharacterized protein n=1 Tax=Fomitiporia mediterranea (strain MF3/22) TaxID=694068 RepID=UPI0004407CE7|nr:uncharacterized protein FOMMEDRAFT_158350 [Fomitiporia mediterranea MF3/22]EJD01218.1 hypothetical protein FOMMEDRAFT_158350 [Fomitiporia mediterranea MF3/22]